MEGGEPVHGRPQRTGNGAGAAPPPPGGQLFSVIGPLEPGRAR